MASNDLKEFLRGVDPDYEQYAERLHQGTFTKKAELGAADKADLEALGIPKGAAGLLACTVRVHFLAAAAGTCSIQPVLCKLPTGCAQVAAPVVLISLLCGRSFIL